MSALSLDPASLLHVATRMRARDRAEVFALLPREFGPADVAHHALALSRWGGMVLADDGEPVAAMGLMPLWPGVASAWMFASDRWREVWRAGVRLCRDTILPAAARDGIWRSQCHSMAVHEEAHRFLRHLGFVAEGRPVPMGRDREVFLPFARVVR